MQNLDMPLVLTPMEARKLLRCGRTKIYELLRCGALRTIPIPGRKKLIPRSAILELLGEPSQTIKAEECSDNDGESDGHKTSRQKANLL